MSYKILFENRRRHRPLICEIPPTLDKCGLGKDTHCRQLGVFLEQLPRAHAKKLPRANTSKLYYYKLGKMPFNSDLLFTSNAETMSAPVWK